MPTACPRNSWEDSLPPGSSRRLSLVENWLRALIIWVLPFLVRILPYMVEGESFSWQVTMMAQQRRLVGLRKSSVFHQSNLAVFRKVDCLCRRVEIAGVN